MMKDGALVRKHYLEELERASGDNKVVKVITGMRGVGKTTLMSQYVAYNLLKHKVRILDYDFDGMCGLDIRTAEQLHDTILTECNDTGRTVIILHEVQKIPNWSPMIADLVSLDIGEFFITASDNRVMEIADFESMKGNVIEIRVTPLSLREFMTLNGIRAIKPAIESYLAIGGLPAVRANMPPEIVFHILDGIFCSSILKDVLPYGKEHSPQTALSLARTIVVESGTVLNAGKVSDASGTSYRKTAPILEAMSSCYLIFSNEGRSFMSRIRRDNLVYFAADIGIRNCIRGFAPTRLNLGENLLMIELKRLGYSVKIEGSDGDRRFIASDEDGAITYTVCEDRPLEKDSCSRVNITMDETLHSGYFTLGRFLHSEED